MLDLDVAPRDILVRTLNHWWVIVITALIGAILGFFLFQIQKPLFEASAAITVNLDYTQTGALTDLQVDQILDTLGDNLLSPTILVPYQESLTEHNSSLSVSDYEHWLWVERAGFRWIARVRSEDPQTAMDAANLFAETSERILNDALIHASNVNIIQLHLERLEGCLVTAVNANPSFPNCEPLDLSDLQEQIDLTNGILSTERSASLGLITAMLINWTEHAQLPMHPVTSNRNLMIMFGAGIGIILGLWFSQWNYFHRLFRKGQHP